MVSVPIPIVCRVSIGYPSLNIILVKLRKDINSSKNHLINLPYIFIVSEHRSLIYEEYLIIDVKVGNFYKKKKNLKNKK